MCVLKCASTHIYTFIIYIYIYIHAYAYELCTQHSSMTCMLPIDYELGKNAWCYLSSKDNRIYLYYLQSWTAMFVIICLNTSVAFTIRKLLQEREFYREKINARKERALNSVKNDDERQINSIDEGNHDR